MKALDRLIGLWSNRAIWGFLKHNRSLAGITIALALTSCTPVPIQLMPRMTVVNRASLAITELRYRSCGATTEIWQSLAVTMPLAPGQAVLTDFPLPCSDLSALYVDGRTAGNQTGIKQQFPFRWDIY